MDRFRLQFIAALVFLLALSASCGRSRKSGFLVGFSQCNLGEPWRVAMNKAAQAEARKYADMEVVYSDAQQDNSKQVADVETFLRQKIDLLIISPNEAQPLTAVVARAYGQKIPVIILDRAIEGETYTCFIGADNREIGRAAGEYAARILGGKGDVVEIQGLPGSPPARDRSEGFHEGISNSPGIRIIHNPVANWLREEALTQMEIALKAHPHIDLVYAHNDPMAVGAYLAAKAAGRQDEMKFIGIDALPGPEGGIQEVIQGRLAATFVYPSCGKDAIETAHKILMNEPVPRRITLKTALITRENAEEYAKKLN
jgi:ribose transport system substrate-binding protein